jgi:hypothetical protein
LRRLRVLVENLPADAAVLRRRGPQWTDVEYLLAMVADQLAFYRYDFARANGATPKEPKPMRRPDDDATEDQAAEVRAAHDHVMAQLRGEE